MPRLSCGLCNYAWDTEIHETWICANCTMASAGYIIEEIGAGEVNALIEVLKDLKSDFSQPTVSPAVFPIFPHEAVLTESVLDLMVLFFDHILLYIDTFNLQENTRDRLLNKLDAYIENEFLSIFDWNGGIQSPVSTKVAHVAYSPRVSRYPWHIHEYIERLANVITRSKFRTRSVFVGADPLEYERRFHLFNRLHGFFILCELLGVSGLSNPVMKGLALESYGPAEKIKTLERATFGLIDWYGEEIQNLPSFARPEVLIKLRRETDPKSFVNTIIDIYDSDPNNDISSEELVRRVRTAINKQVDLARRISAQSYPIKKALLTGLIATAGGFLGGISGAVLGGIGASLIPETVERLDRKRVAPWSAFFLEP